MSIGWNTGGGGAPSGPAGGDLAGTYPDPEVDGLQGEPVAATAPSEGDVLTFTAGEWTPAVPAGGLPSQTGNENKVLTTDGANATWTDTLVDVALTGVDAALTIQSALDLNISSTGGLIDIQSALDVNITALGGLVGQFGDNISLNTSNGTAELGGTGTTSLASVSANVSISANNGIALNTTTGIVSVPNRLAGDSSQAAANTAFVAAAIAAGILPAYFTTAAVGPTISGTGLQTYITVTTPSLAAGTYSVAWSVVSTHTATGSSQGVQMTAGASVVPTATIDGGASTTSGGRTIVQARGFYVHAGGTLALLVQVRRSSGTGNVIPQAGSIELRRVA